MDQKQWKQNQRIKKAFLPLTAGLLAIMVMQGGCALPGNSGQDTGTQAASDTGESAVVDYTCIANETDVSGQISLIEKAQQQGADGILLAPANSNTLVESCQKIKDQNISLVLIDSSINSDAYDACYMTGNMEAGQIAAREMLSMLSEQENTDQDSLEVGILLSAPVALPTRTRAKTLYPCAEVQMQHCMK